jgi:hypothetical protein
MILYALIANYASYDTLVAARPNLKTITQLFTTNILTKLAEHEKREKKVYSHKMFDIYVIADGDIVICALADNATSEKLGHAFTEDVEKEYKNALMERGEQGAREEAGRLLEEKLAYYQDTSIARVERLQNNKDVVKDATTLDISEIITRDEELNVILDYVSKNSSACTVL